MESRAVSATHSLWARSFPAPAKLNLFLHVVGRRADGYHLLQTVFRLIDLNDTLRYSPRSDGEVRLASEVDGLPADNDLCVRAARALKAETGHPGGVDIHLDKRIPMGGGLGGGSSDAATTLLALNCLWGLGLPAAALQRLGLALGADVPVFLAGHNAFAEGVGEKLAPLVLPPAWYLVLVPPVAVPTVTVFAAQELTRNTKIVKISGFSAGSGQYQSGFGHNDLEPVVCSRYPQVAEHLAWLGSQLSQLGIPADARMSGSGACVFAEFSTESDTRSVASRMPSGMRGFVVRGLDKHPLRGLLEAG
jgi:4-diphosphocytidyl-2-C-methyl-D-erythritol kinase